MYNFERYQLLDSMAIDGDGNICVATLVTGAVSVVSPAGRLLEQVKVPRCELFVTNSCFGGPNLQTAYTASSGYGLPYEMNWSRPGHLFNANTRGGKW